MADLAYFLPCGLKSALEHETAASLTISEETSEIDGFNIPGFILKGTQEVLTTFVQNATLSFGIHKATAFLSLQTLKVHDAVTTPIGLCARIGVDPVVMFPLEKGRRDYAELIPLTNDLKQTLAWLSDYAGIEILLDVRDGGFAPTTPRGSKILHVVLGASAPGEAIISRYTHLCGTQLAQDGSLVEYPYGPSCGSGVLVRDDENDVVAQIVGNTLFVFVPIDLKFERVLREQDGLGLFKKALRYTWNTYVENPEVPQPTELGESKAYVELVEQWLDFFPSVQRHLIEDEEKELRKLHARYLGKLQYLQILRAGLQVAITLHTDHDKERSAGDFERLRSNALLRTVGVLTNGLQVVTHPIVCEYEGKRYSLGSYTIRISQSGDVSVWAESSTHPTGYPHPHIGWSGSPCFGNISIAIDHAAVEHRLADTIELVLRWLTEGYDPKLAETPITEWPEEVEA